MGMEPRFLPEQSGRIADRQLRRSAHGQRVRGAIVADETEDSPLFLKAGCCADEALSAEVIVDFENR